MNNPIRFKMKMLIVLTFCFIMTFYMLVYVVKLSGKCGGELCFWVRKRGEEGYKGEGYVLYSGSEVSWEGWKGRRMSLGGGEVSSVRVGGGEVLEGYSVRWRSGAGDGRGRLSGGGYSLREGEEVKGVKGVKEVKEDGEEGEGDGEGEGGREVYRERRRTLERFCDKYLKGGERGEMKKVQLNHILMDEKHKVLYCYVPKVACTNWKRIFLVLTGKARDISEVVSLPSSEVHAKNLFKSLENYTVAEVARMSEEYRKFIFVRHPFERLLSAYRNKLEQHYDSSKYFQARFGRYIIRNFRKNPSNASLERGDDVTFAEFVRYLLSREPSSYNEHWQRVTDLCHPCLVKYDFIGKYETLREDSRYLLRSLGLNVSFPILPKPSTTATNLKKYYNTLGKSAIYKLYNIYQMDFRLFGYDLFNVSDWSNNS